VTGKVWMPTKKESVKVAKVNYPDTWKKLTDKTWFTTTLQQPSATSTTFTNEWRDAQGISKLVLPPNKKKKGKRTRGAATTKKAKAPEDQAARLMKVQALPTTAQKETLRQWIGTCRWTYNRCVAYGRDHPGAPIKDLRAQAVNNGTLKGQGLDWAVKIPYDVRDEAARDYFKAVASNKAKQEEKPDHVYEVKFRSRNKAAQETINVLGKHTQWDPTTPSQLSFFSFAFPHPLQLAEPLPARCFEAIPNKGLSRCLYDLRLTREKTGDWFLCLPLPLNHLYPRTLPLSAYRNPSPDAPKERKVVALDPGVRTFLTGYSPNGQVFEISPGDSPTLIKVAERVDQLQSGWTKVKAKKRRRMKKKAHRLRRRLRNLTTEVHRKAAKLLVASYDTILIPTFEVSQMVEKDDRVIQFKTVRNLLNWRHYAFRQLLVAKAREMKGVRVLEVSEAYTSKTCGRCGKIHATLGSNKVFTCPHCNLRLDRDGHAGRNIFLRNMGLVL